MEDHDHGESDTEELSAIDDDNDAMSRRTRIRKCKISG